LADIQAHDAALPKVLADIQAGDFITLAAYRAKRNGRRQ
jgi:hypothetical protein